MKWNDYFFFTLFEKTDHSDNYLKSKLIIHNMFSDPTIFFLELESPHICQLFNQN